MDNEIFKKQVENELQKMQRKQVVFFAWLCAVRVLPFIGAKGNFNYWKKENRQRYLYAIFRALDVSFYFVDFYTTDIAVARSAAIRSANSAADAYAVSAVAYAVIAAYDTDTTIIDAIGEAGDAIHAAITASAIITIQDILLMNIEEIKKDLKISNIDLKLYGKMWDNFQKALDDEGCKYWGDLYKNIFEQSFELDKDALNKRMSVPKEIQSLGATAVADYLKQIRDYGVDTLYEGKILIVGEAGAGKTTLFRKLENPKLRLPRTKSTLGVVVKELSLPHPEKSKIKMSANLWDFGGQEIQYYLHQYFITTDALYILVSDNREQNTQWDYWFHIIELLAGKCPVLAVLNNKETTSPKSDFEKTKYKKWFPTLDIKEREVNFAINNDDWTSLQNTIKKLFSKLPVVNDPIPTPWIELREALLEKRERCNYTFLNEFYQIETQKKITIEHKKLALDYFNRIGIITYFSEDKNLKDIIFLNPNWITQGLYAAMDSDNVKLGYGQFTEEWIYDFWSKHKNKYKDDEQSYLLRLMLKNKFNICYELENQEKTYVIPFLLPEKQPEFKWNNENNIGFKIQYPFMPKGILSQLTVQLNEKIELNTETNKQLVWKDGVILKDNKHGSRAKIISDYDSQSGSKYIDIRIFGTSLNSKKELLQMVRNKIEEIHTKSFKGVNPTELICCICEKCKISNDPHYFKMDAIERYLEAGETQIKCEKSIKSVNIDELIGPVYSIEEIERMKPKIERRYPSNYIEKMTIIKDSTNCSIVTDSEHFEINENIFNFYNCNIDLQGNLKDLASSLKRKERIEEAAVLEEAAAVLSEAEECKTPEEVKKKGIANKLKRIVEDLGNENSKLHKTVKGIKHGISIAQDIAKGYNDIAQWCGFPQVPKPFLGKE